MTLNEHLVKLSEYGIGFNMYEGTVIVNVLYPKKWSVLKPETSNINITDEDGRFYYWANISDIDELFDLIYTTIDYNKAIEEKAALFKAKINEMQQLFLKEDLDVLKTLEFKVKKKKQKQTKEVAGQQEIVKQEDIPQEKQQIEENVIHYNDVENMNDDTEEASNIEEEKVIEPTENDLKIAAAVAEMNKEQK